MNPYDTLDVATTATDKEIRKSYKAKAMQHHPDKGGDEEEFKELTTAYNVLSDPDRRRQYDETGTTEKSQEDSAESMLAELFNNVINQDKIEGDLIENARAMVHSSLNQLGLMLDQSTNTLATNEAMMGRITTHLKSNTFDNIIRDRIKNDNRRLVDLKKQIALLGELLLLLDQYEDSKPLDNWNTTQMFR